jgi:hypothetical protein
MNPDSYFENKIENINEFSSNNIVENEQKPEDLHKLVSFRGFGEENIESNNDLPNNINNLNGFETIEKINEIPTRETYNNDNTIKEIQESKESKQVQESKEVKEIHTKPEIKEKTLENTENHKTKQDAQNHKKTPPIFKSTGVNKPKPLNNNILNNTEPNNFSNSTNKNKIDNIEEKPEQRHSLAENLNQFNHILHSQPNQSLHTHINPIGIILYDIKEKENKGQQNNQSQNTFQNQFPTMSNQITNFAHHNANNSGTQPLLSPKPTFEIKNVEHEYLYSLRFILEINSKH